MENNDFNKRILNKLEEKIAIEEFRKENNIQKKKKSNVFLKVASFIAVLSIVSANLFTYATFKQDVITYVLDKLGIFTGNNKESLVQINETQECNDITLTLENYVIENDILIIGYKLKANKDVDLGVKYIIDDTNLIRNGETYHIDKSTSFFLTPISDTEYELLKIYNIGNFRISDEVFLETKLFLPKYLDIGENIGEWEFKIKLEESKKVLNSEKYIVEDIGGTWEDASNDYWFDHSFSILEVENTNTFTKLTIILNDYLTGGEAYTVEVTDENGKIILEEGIQNLFGLIPTEIILKKLELNSKIIINVYEKEDTRVSRKASCILDLSNNLKPKEEKEIKYTTITWKNLKFRYDKEMSVDKSSSKDFYGDTNYYIDFGLYKIIGNKKESYSQGTIQIWCNENIGNHTLQEIVDEQLAIGLVAYRDSLFKDRYPLYLQEGIDVILNHDQMMELSKNRETTVNGITINSDNYELAEPEYKDIKNIKIGEIDTKTWVEYNDRVYMFVYKENYYLIRTPNEINAIERVKEFINNIEFL